MAYQPLLTDAEMTQIAFWLLVLMGLSGFVFDFIRKIWRHFRKARKSQDAGNPEVTGNPEDASNA